jgi:DNA ligase-1
MNRFAALLDRLAYEPRRNAKTRLITAHFRETPDPERGLALAAMTGGLVFRNAKAGLVRALIEERVDPILFRMSYDYVGDLSETVALLWPARPGLNHEPTLLEVVETLNTASRSELPQKLASLLDALDETGRWACLKLITGGLRIGVSARLAKTAVAALGTLDPDEIEEVWHGLSPPYTALFAWAEGRALKPAERDPAPFRPVMLAHPLEEADLDGITPETHAAEWKWDGIRVQAVAAGDQEHRVARLYTRTGDDISAGFPDLLATLTFDASIDGELLVADAGCVRPFGDLQQRLNRKSVSARMMSAYPVIIRAYDMLVDRGEDLRALPFVERRQRLEAFMARERPAALDLSELISFANTTELAEIRAGADASREGLMLKRHDAPYLPGRPKGLWWKWKRVARLVDCVMMYAQRGHGKRSSFYSDYTFGVWQGERVVPVGKAYSGFTDAELKKLDRFVRDNTTNRFGPVREVAHSASTGLVLEIAFEGLQRSTRHKSGIAMRFPRINRIRWDKPSEEADHLETLERLLAERVDRGTGTLAPEPQRDET